MIQIWYICKEIMAGRLIDYPCFNWYWVSSFTNWKRNSSIFWIPLSLFTGESYCWIFKLFMYDLEEMSICHWLKIPQKKSTHPYTEEEQTTQWPKENKQKDKQRSTKHTYKTKDRVTRTPLKTGGELRCSGRVGCRQFLFH